MMADENESSSKEEAVVRTTRGERYKTVRLDKSGEKDDE